MGARNPENNANKTFKFYSLKAKVDEKNEPFFSLTEKVDDAWKQTGKFNEMFGNITKAEIITKEFKNETIKLFRLHFVDENEVSFVDMSHNGITYNIISSLCSDFDADGTFILRVYKTESESADGRVFHNGKAFLSVNGESLSWGVDMKTAPRAKVVEKSPGVPLVVNGTTITDKDEMRAFWEDKFNTIVVPKFGGAISEKQAKEAEPKNEPETNEIDDLPF